MTTQAQEMREVLNIFRKPSKKTDEDYAAMAWDGLDKAQSQIIRAVEDIKHHVSNLDSEEESIDALTQVIDLLEELKQNLIKYGGIPQ